MILIGTKGESSTEISAIILMRQGDWHENGYDIILTYIDGDLEYLSAEDDIYGITNISFSSLTRTSKSYISTNDWDMLTYIKRADDGGEDDHSFKLESAVSLNLSPQIMKYSFYHLLQYSSQTNIQYG